MPDRLAESGHQFAGDPDGLERLWVPHRMAYINGADKPPDDEPGEGCPFCRAPTRTDDEGLVVFRGESAFVVMNLYPYNSGHLLICPYRHVSSFMDLTAIERTEVGVLTAAAMLTLTAVYAPHGFNSGMNQGAVAGAGVAAHLHQHVVPRWHGDANFLPIVARTRALPELLGDARARLAAAWTLPVEDNQEGNR